jgi:glycosyltransferase involved in cell wall biosynthesis
MKTHTPTTARPLVSVLIRTMGRATLARAIAAAVAQSHRPLEIVVVNASGKPLPALPATGDAALRVVEGGPYDRPRAANAGLDHAKGDWLVFLDDDDAFAPNHVESLLAAIARSDGARVAYSASAVVEPDGRARMIIGAEFNRQHLFIGNYMQIGAVLFHRSLVEEGARFDERIGCYEDWDFVIQLAQLTHFVYTARPTNYWCAYAGESGAGLGANKRDEATRPFHDMVVAKWAERARMVR